MTSAAPCGPCSEAGFDGVVWAAPCRRCSGASGPCREQGLAMVPGRGLGWPRPEAAHPAAGVRGHPHFIPSAPGLQPRRCFLELERLGPGFQKSSGRSRAAKACGRRVWSLRGGDAVCLQVKRVFLKYSSWWCPSVMS